MNQEQKLRLAADHHQHGRLAQAEKLYREILARQPDHADAMHLLGVLANQTGHHKEACRWIQKAIELKPAAEFYFNLAGAWMPLGEADRAIDALQKVVALKPNWAAAHSNLGILLQGKQQLQAALAEFQMALSLEPANPEFHYNFGNALMELQRRAEAVDAFRAALKIKPDHADALNNLANTLLSLGKLEEAHDAIRQALQIRPQFPQALNSFASILVALNCFEEAVAALRRAIQIQPSMMLLYNNLGNLLARLGRYEEAAEVYRQGIALKPNWAAIHNNLSVTLGSMGDLDGSIAEAKIAIEQQPGFFLARENLAQALDEKGEIDAATDILTELVREKPDDDSAQNNYGNALRHSGRLAEALQAYRRGAEADPSSYLTASNYLFTLQFYSEDADELLAAHQDWNRRYAEPLRAAVLPHANNRDPNRRLKIGYVSPDFRNHCQALFTNTLLPNHDHERFEIFCYSSVRRPDAVSAKLRAHADVWRAVAPLPDSALTELIRADGIDILVDLTMHMGQARPLVFAQKPAPVQVAWLAYPGTTGIWSMDYRLTDPYLDPAGFDNRYTEQSIRMPNTFWCYDPYGMEAKDSPPLPEPGELPAKRNGFVTFGCLNEFSKISAGTIARWGKLMQAVPHSRMHVLAPRGRCREGVLEQFKPFGILPDRIEFIGRKLRPAYLAEYRRIDLCLDTLPYNGHTTSLDAFWMGVAVLTQIGKTVVGRAGLSQLSNLKLADFAAETDEQFVELGRRWASDLAALGEIRRTLRDRMSASPLMDGNRFARDMESAFAATWKRWVEEESNRQAGY